MKLFDQNNDGLFDLQDMARLVNVSENFLLQFKIQVNAREYLKAKKFKFRRLFLNEFVISYIVCFMKYRPRLKFKF